MIMHVFMCMHIYIYIYLFIYIYIYLYIYIFIYLYIYICIYIDSFIYIYVYLFMCVCKPLKHREWNNSMLSCCFHECDLKLFTLRWLFLFNLRLAFLLYMRKFRSTAGGHGSIHQSVANEVTDVWRGYAV